MVRKKWKNRSKEDQERIARETQEAREPGKTTTYTITSEGDEAQLEILKKNEIPLLCAKHSWVHSNHYTLTLEKMPILDVEATTVNGICPKCGHYVKRYLPPEMMVSNFGMVLSLLIPLLINQGRLEDKR